MKSYGKAFLKCLSARAVWEAGQQIEAGYYGEIIDGCFVTLGSLTELGIKCEPSEVIEDGFFEFSRGVNSDFTAKTSAEAKWVGKALATIDWKGGAGLYMASHQSQLKTIKSLGEVVRSILKSGKWRFGWRLVRQVRLFNKGVIIFGKDSTAAGTLHLSNEIPLDGSIQSKVTAGGLSKSEFAYFRDDVVGAAYVHCLRLKPFLTTGAAPLLDHELWYEDIYEDE